jgi:hypothetical protein
VTAYMPGTPSLQRCLPIQDHVRFVSVVAAMRIDWRSQKARFLRPEPLGIVDSPRRSGSRFLMNRYSRAPEGQSG